MKTLRNSLLLVAFFSAIFVFSPSHLAASPKIEKTGLSVSVGVGRRGYWHHPERQPYYVYPDYGYPRWRHHHRWEGYPERRYYYYDWDDAPGYYYYHRW